MPVYQIPFGGDICVLHTGTMTIITPFNLYRGAYIEENPDSNVKVPLSQALKDTLQFNETRFLALSGLLLEPYFVARIPDCNRTTHEVFFKYYTWSPYFTTDQMM
jgi:hypothetical protein